MADRILIVDDEPGILKMLVLVFTRAGWEVDTAISGEKAIDVLVGSTFDVVLSDVTMAGMDGHELAKWVCLHDTTTLFVMMSGLFIDCDGCPLARRCVVLEKPFAPKDAEKRIRGLLTANRGVYIDEQQPGTAINPVQP